MQGIATFRTFFHLGTLTRIAYDGCMNHHDQTSVTKQDTDYDISDPQAPLVSAMLPALLDYLRVEEHHTPTVALTGTEARVR